MSETEEKKEEGQPELPPGAFGFSPPTTEGIDANGVFFEKAGEKNKWFVACIDVSKFPEKDAIEFWNSMRFALRQHYTRVMSENAKRMQMAGGNGAILKNLERMRAKH